MPASWLAPPVSTTRARGSAANGEAALLVGGTSGALWRVAFWAGAAPAPTATIAAIAEDDAALRSEAADLLYHLLVLLRARCVEIADVMTELEARTNRSGHEEKASRRE